MRCELRYAARAPSTLGPGALAATWRFDGRALGAFTHGFAPVLYLAAAGRWLRHDRLQRGRSSPWWLVLLGAAVGVLPRQGFGWLAWASAGLLGVFVVWTLIASGWSGSAERTAGEVGRVA